MSILSGSAARGFLSLTFEQPRVDYQTSGNQLTRGQLVYVVSLILLASYLLRSMSVAWNFEK